MPVLGALRRAGPAVGARPHGLAAGLVRPQRPPRRPRATGDEDAAPAAAAPPPPPPAAAAPNAAQQANLPLPKRGYFSIADPNAEVYSKAGEQFDPEKKPGRWKPEFIWNTNWQEQLKLQEDLERQRREYLQAQREGRGKGANGDGAGVVSISRLSALDDMSVDLTEQLLKAKQRDEERRRKAEAAAAARAAAGDGDDGQQQQQQRPQVAAARPRRSGGGAGASPSYQYKDPLSRGEIRRFERANRTASRGVSIDAVGQLAPAEAARRAAEAEAALKRYERLKADFLIWTLGAGALGIATAEFLYGKDIAASYAVGAVSGLLYLRLLGRSVDSIGGNGRSTGGAPRLLIPVILVLVFNRWNQVYAADYGLTLQLIPMLLGFFTYKLAVLGRQGLAELSSFSVVQKKGGEEETFAGSAPEGDASNLDRIFVRRVTREF
ncbi:hypothetical protein Rsub_11228 [Raphidocelis subcapitata]|uniref:CGL160/ATPI domain-containing protein n=1 Tax=Raphidocelis subcapitata TaxID=307507 RepID=A0A2V0PER4_9CHLO|nr:hypothetical protein Rsub_11228 [Raphidocelis subcapitata]|eukprot:GBF98334.1 hypothetical protein Rsub_11228 [Raphidocelis subcapitata]